MAFKQLHKVRLSNANDLTSKNINAMQDNISAALGQVIGKDVLDMSLLKGISLNIGLNKVAHGLGRNLQGYWVARSHGGYPLIYDTQDTNKSPALLLYLMSATAITVDLVVF